MADGKNEHSVILSVHTSEPDVVQRTVETLSRVATGLGLEGLDTHLAIHTYVPEDETADEKRDP